MGGLGWRVRCGPLAKTQPPRSSDSRCRHCLHNLLSLGPPAAGTIVRGWALAMQGQGDEGISQMQQGLAAFRATGAEFLQPYYLALLAEGYGRVGQTEEGLRLLAEALATAHHTGERFWEAELHRLQGELSLALWHPVVG